MLHTNELKDENKEIPEYYAPNPYYNISLTGLKFLDAILYSIASLPNRLLGERSIQYVLPARGKKARIPLPEALAYFENSDAFKICRSYVFTYDGAVLDTIEINYGKKDPIYIIKFNGNASFYEHNLESYLDDAYRLHANVIGFNYRGVGESTGIPDSITKLVTDGIAEVQRILSRGVPPKSIVLDGISLGAGIATLVAKFFHDQGIKVNLFNDRSFSTISSAATHICYHDLKPFKEAIAENTFSCSIRTINWQINAVSAFAALPAANKAYMFVTDEEKYIGNLGDGVIPQKSSLHEALKNSRGQGDKFYPMVSFMNPGHNESRKNLKSIALEDLNGEKIFDSFVKRVTR